MASRKTRSSKDNVVYHRSSDDSSEDSLPPPGPPGPITNLIQKRTTFSLSLTNITGKKAGDEYVVVTKKTTKRKRPDFSGTQEIVNVTVHAFAEGEQPSSSSKNGTNQQTKRFPVHKTHICHYSPFFAAALNGSFAEASTNAVELYEVRPEIFSVFTNWIYAQELVSPTSETLDIPTLVHIYLLADRLLMPSLQNAAIDLMDHLRCTKTLAFPPQLFPLVYEKTAAGSLLRRYLVVLDFIGPIHDPTNYPREMLVDVVHEYRNCASTWRSPRSDSMGKLMMGDFHVDEDEDEDEREKRRRM